MGPSLESSSLRDIAQGSTRVGSFLVDWSFYASGGEVIIGVAAYLDIDRSLTTTTSWWSPVVAAILIQVHSC